MLSLTILMNSLRIADCPVTIYLEKIAKCVVWTFVSLSVNIPFLFGAVCVKSGIWDWIAPVPGHCLSIYLATRPYGKYAYLFLLYKLHRKYELLKPEVLYICWFA